MKSILVDVLRQAQHDDRSRDPVDDRRAVDEAATGAPQAVAPAAPPDLNLLNTGEFVTSPEVGCGEPTYGPAGDIALQSSDLELPEIEDVGAESAPLAATAVLTARGAKLSEKKSLIVRIGRMAPALCLVTISIGALGYLLVARLAAVSLNEDLNDMSARVRTTAGGEWQNQPAAAINVFDKVVVVTLAEEPVAADIAKPGPVAPVSSKASVADPVARINTYRSVGENTGVNDRAFGFVRDGYAAYREKDYFVAEAHYTNALAVEPNHNDALAGLAAVYQQTSREESAIRIYERLLAVDPASTLAASALLAIQSRDSGRDSESELKHLLQRFPDAHHLHFALGTVYVAQDRWPDARLAFHAAHKLEPANADYSYNLAVSMEKLGDLGGAQIFYQTALDTADERSKLDHRVIEAHLSKLQARLREPS